MAKSKITPKKAALPGGDVGTSVLAEFVGYVLGRKVGRQDIINAGLTRARGRALSAKGRAVQVRIEPSARGARDEGRWTAGDCIRMSAVLLVSKAGPSLRAAAWHALPDEWAGGVAAYAQAAIAKHPGGGRKPDEVARDAEDAVAAEGRVFVDLPLDGSEAVLAPHHEIEAAPASLAYARIDVGTIVARWLTFWEYATETRGDDE